MVNDSSLTAHKKPRIWSLAARKKPRLHGLICQKSFVSVMLQVLFLTKSTDPGLGNCKVDHISAKLKVWVMKTSKN